MPVPWHSRLFPPNAVPCGVPKTLVVWLFVAPKALLPPLNKPPPEVVPAPKAGLLTALPKSPPPVVFVLLPKADVGFVVLLVAPKVPKPVDVPAVEVLLPNRPPLLVVVPPKAGLAPNGEDPWLVPKPVREDILVIEGSGLFVLAILCSGTVAGGAAEAMVVIGDQGKKDVISRNDKTKTAPAPAHMILSLCGDRGKVVVTFERRRALCEYVRSQHIPPEPKPLELPLLPKTAPPVFIVPPPNPVFCCCPKPRGCENMAH